MTFEEFFAKKKIDLVQLEKAEPMLYTEFKSHFAAMGEKSFDHTKKFWFNKLRGQYHLATPEKEITQVETAIASQAEPLSSPTIEQKPAFTPRFKSAAINKVETPPEQAASTPAPKPAFKPRNIPVKEPVTENKSIESSSSVASPTAKKPAFKPRNIPARAESAEKKEEVAEPVSPIKAPGFKPRNIKAVASENAIDANRAESRPGQTKIAETPITPSLPVEENVSEVPPKDINLDAIENASTEESKPKPAYKPKFNLKTIKPKDDKTL